MEEIRLEWARQEVDVDLGFGVVNQFAAQNARQPLAGPGNRAQRYAAKELSFGEERLRPCAQRGLRF